MKRFSLIISLLMVFILGAQADNKFRLKVDGPEKTYNMVRVINQSHYAEFTCTVFFLEAKKDGTFLTGSAVGTYTLKESGDTDSNRVRVKNGEWLGIKLPEGIADVNVSISYKDMPMFDIVDLVITDGTAPAVGEEF